MYVHVCYMSSVIYTTLSRPRSVSVATRLKTAHPNEGTSSPKAECDGSFWRAEKALLLEVFVGVCSAVAAAKGKNIVVDRPFLLYQCTSRNSLNYEPDLHAHPLFPFVCVCVCVCGPRGIGSSTGGPKEGAAGPRGPTPWCWGPAHAGSTHRLTGPQCESRWTVAKEGVMNLHDAVVPPSGPCGRA